MSKEAMKLALEALISYGKSPYIKQSHPKRWANGNEAIKALEEALAKQEQGEPVAVRQSNGEIYVLGSALVPIGAYLYTTPQQRTWVGLTDDEKADIAAKGHQRWKEYAEAIEAKLKEKNT